jgi:arsenite transporter
VETIEARPALGTFERYLTLWVGSCIAVGIALGHLFPNAFSVIAGLEIAKVNLPVAVLIWLMIVPMLLKIDFGALGEVRKHWRGVGLTLFINWGVKPFSMALLAWIFIATLFAPMLPQEEIPSYSCCVINPTLAQ